MVVVSLLVYDSLNSVHIYRFTVSFACFFFWSPNFFSFRNFSFSLMLIVLLNFGGVERGALFRNIHETTMEWSECGTAGGLSERGTSLASGGARDGGHSFVSVASFVDGSLLLTIHTRILSPTLFNGFFSCSIIFSWLVAKLL